MKLSVLIKANKISMMCLKAREGATSKRMYHRITTYRLPSRLRKHSTRQIRNLSLTLQKFQTSCTQGIVSTLSHLRRASITDRNANKWTLSIQSNKLSPRLSLASKMLYTSSNLRIKERFLALSNLRKSL